VRIGLHALGIGAGADPLVISAVARAAEQNGFATLWAGEHVVMVDRPDSKYPYADDGRIAVPSAADWLDPLDLLAFLSAVTSTIRLATGVLLLPEHNPVVVAKRAATVDVLSGGRLTLGVGIGWSAEEFAALGVPFRGRGARTEEYIDVLRALWRDDVASHTGSHVQFDRVRCYPKPIRRSIPVVLGGNSDGALERAARCGDGWYGFNVSLGTLPERLGFLRSACQERGRAASELDTAVALVGASATDLPDLEALGVTELVLVEAPPADARDAWAWVEGLAHTWRVTA
jgi:probable F420-dependent oxidoreductase